MPRIFALSLIAVLGLGCDTKDVLEPLHEPRAPMLAKGGPADGTEFATLSKLPTLKSGPAEAYAINQPGSVIAGHSYDGQGIMQAVTWRLQNGNWTITRLPIAATALAAQARGVNDQGDVAGNFFPGPASPHVVLWPSAGGFSVLGCNEFSVGNAITAGAQIIAGMVTNVTPTIASVWQPGSCRQDLPPLLAGGGAGAYAINGDGTIVGGISGSPVRWRHMSGVWQIEQLDSRPGGVLGANSVGDLVGQVQVACASPSTGQCSRGMIWYENGTSRELSSLGGESTAPRGINAAGEVVGLSTLANGDGVPFFWSEATGMRQLPVNSRGGWAFAVSGVRSDGTRMVVGVGGRPSSPLVWVVRIP